MHLNGAKLNLLSWNAQSIANRTKNFELELLLRDNNIHIACIQETYLSNGTKVHLENYSLYRHDRDTHGGGVAIAVRNNIRHELLSVINTGTIENISVAVYTGQRKIVITSAYSPHHSEHFLNDIILLASGDGERMIFGDFNAMNADWHCETNNASGNALFNYINSSDFILHAPGSPTPTHYPHSGANPSTIDLLLTNVSQPIDDFCALDYMVSDHRPVFCRLDAAYTKVKKLTFRYDLANWESYRSTIRDINFTPSVETSEEIDDSIDRFSAIIIRARDMAVPTTLHRDRLLRIAPDTLNDIKYRNRLNRQWQRCQNLMDKARIKTSVNIIGKLIGDLIRRDRNARWTEFVGEIDGESKKFWRVSRSLCAKRGTMPNIIRHDGMQLITGGEKA